MGTWKKWRLWLKGKKGSLGPTLKTQKEANSKVLEVNKKARSRVGDALTRGAASEREVAETDGNMDTALDGSGTIARRTPVSSSRDERSYGKRKNIDEPRKRSWTRCAESSTLPCTAGGVATTTATATTKTRSVAWPSSIRRSWTRIKMKNWEGKKGRSGRRRIIRRSTCGVMKPSEP